MKSIKVIFLPSMFWAYLTTGVQVVGLNFLLFILTGIDYTLAFVVSSAMLMVWIGWKIQNIKFKDLLQRVEVATHQVDDLLEIAERKTNELVQKNEGLASLLHQLSEKEKQVSALKNQLTELSQQLSQDKNKLTQTNSELEERVTSLQSTVSYLKQQISQKDREITQVRAELETVGEIANKKKLTTLKQSISALLRLEKYEEADSKKREYIELGGNIEDLKIL